MRDLSGVSTYFLMLELMDGGEVGVLPELEPIAAPEIFFELESRTSESFGSSKDDWANWFLGAATYGTELERANFRIFLDTKNMASSLATSRLANPADYTFNADNKVSRVEILTLDGQAYVNKNCSSVRIVEQDEGRTIKIFLLEGDV
ncbi:MAG: hypothetical protein AAFN80_10150 [Pseudomonadota bacterium]